MTDVLTLSRKHWKNHLMVYRLVNTSCLSCSNTNTHHHYKSKLCHREAAWRLFLTKCCFSLGMVLYRMRSWCSWKRISFGKPGTKNPEEETRGPGSEAACLDLLSFGALGCLTVHGVLLSRQQLDQSPEGVFFVHVDEQQGCDLTHSLTVAHLLQQQSGSALWSSPSDRRCTTEELTLL